MRWVLEREGRAIEKIAIATTLLGAALVTLCGGAARAASDGRHVQLPVRPTIGARVRSAGSTAATYTIEDHGMPAAGTYSSSAPLGFNDAGQIYGIAARKAKAVPAIGHVDQSCLVWTGAKFVDLEPSLSVTACDPYGMDSPAEATGTFSVVGAFSDVNGVLGELDAFSASIGATGTAKPIAYRSYYPSTLYGISSKGIADGFSFDSQAKQPDPYHITGPMVVTVAPEAMTPLQPPNCTSANGPCLLPVQAIPEHQLDGEPMAQCAFGGCTINASGIVLGYDSHDREYAVAQSGVPASAKLLLAFFDGVVYNFAVALDDANQLLYFTEALDSKHTVTAALYDLTSRTSQALPPVPGTSCAHYFPIAINSSGEVLGYTSFCAQHDFYWTWDAAHGTRSITANIPASAYTITPLAINDEGQILVSLQTSAGATHWGTLDPPAAAPAAKDLRHVR